MGADPATARREEVRRMFASIVGRYDLLNRLLSLRRDVYWRRVAVALGQIPRGGDVLDLCAGTGDVALEIVRQGSGARVIAVDNCEPMLIRGLHKAKRANAADQIRFAVAPAEELPFADATFDRAFVAFGVRNIADRRRGLREMARVLKPDGRAIILEFSTPSSPLLGPLYRFYSHRILPWIGGLVSGNRAAYEYLPASVDGFPSPEGLQALMEDAGFNDVSVVHLTFRIVTVHQGRKAARHG
ncbi:MAG: bifunctional demethylmenaquinone methyltransferase/2-methoxy-6-polyprenyl-1,4-benzoquinol methylase UbiE [Candidatus Methylomirabilales bacterium]